MYIVAFFFELFFDEHVFIVMSTSTINIFKINQQPRLSKKVSRQQVVPKGLRISNNYHTEHARKILKKAELMKIWAYR